ncbi:hypothetical protein T439DRAFT_322774 [Meredithblackwellia eburnea MCA 4105]
MSSTPEYSTTHHHHSHSNKQNNSNNINNSNSSNNVRYNPMKSPKVPSSPASRPRLSPNERANNSYFAVPPTPANEGGPAGAGFDFGFPLPGSQSGNPSQASSSTPRSTIKRTGQAVTDGHLHQAAFNFTLPSSSSPAPSPKLQSTTIVSTPSPSAATTSSFNFNLPPSTFGKSLQGFPAPPDGVPQTPLEAPSRQAGAPTPGAFNPFLPAAASSSSSLWSNQSAPVSLSVAPQLAHRSTSPSFPTPTAPLARPRQTSLTGPGVAATASSTAARTITNPRFTSFTPAELLDLLAASTVATPSPIESPSATPTPISTVNPPSLLVLDLRTHSAWIQCRARDSINICVPSTLLRRPNHGVEQIGAPLAGKDRERFFHWNSSVQTIVVVDMDSGALLEGSGVSSLLAKFVKAGFNGTLAWVKGGFAAVKSEALEGAGTLRDLLEFGGVAGETPKESGGTLSTGGRQPGTPTTLASPGKHARPVLQVRDLPISAFQASTTSAFAHSGLPTASLNQAAMSSAGSKASSGGRPGVGKRRKSGTESFGLTLDSMSQGTATPAAREVLAEKRMVTNPFFDNIRQNTEALSLERSLANLSPVDLPSAPPELFAHLPPFLCALLRLPPMERAYRLARQFYELEAAERERLEGTLSWHANVQGTHLEHSQDHQFKKFGISAGVELGSLNRFKNIFPYDHARVRLQQFGSGATDYVNASHIRLDGSPRRFIASQGPLHSTFPDFWQMCHQEHVGVIIMLTNLHEGGREKCSRYWIPSPTCGWDVRVEGGCSEDDGPGGGFFGGETSSSEPEDSTVRRAITIKRRDDPQGQSRKIRHIQYRAWPDFDIPAQATDVIDLVREVEQAQLDYMAEVNWQEEEEPSILVHCSAGVGRTGVFIMVSTMLEKLKRERMHPSPSLDERDAMEVDRPGPGGGAPSPPLPSPASTTSSSDTASIAAGLSASTLEPSPVSSLSTVATSAFSVTSEPPLDDFSLPSSSTSGASLDSSEPIFRGVNEMREQRMSMVANYRQFCCVHECVLTGALREIEAELAAAAT